MALNGIPFPPKPWVDGQSFEFEQDGSTVTGVYNASSNAWTFTRSNPGATTGQITTATVVALDQRPEPLAASPFSDSYQGTQTQQDINWFLFDDIEATVRYSDDQPSADNFVNRFWWDTNTQVLYVWDGGKWQLSSPNAASQNVTRGVTIDASGGSVNETGNLKIKQDANTAGSGRFLVEDSGGANTFKMYPTGAFETYGSISFTGSNTTKTIRAWGATNPKLRFQIGPDAQNLFEQLSMDTNYVTVSAAGGFIVDNTATLRGALNVTGLTTLSGGLVSDESAIVKKNLNVYEDGYITGDFSVLGDVASTLKLKQNEPLAFNSGALQNITLSKNTSIRFGGIIQSGGGEGDPTEGGLSLGVQDTSRFYVSLPTRINFDTQYETKFESPKINRWYLGTGAQYWYSGSGAGTTPASSIIAIMNANKSYGLETWKTLRTNPYDGSTCGLELSCENNGSSTWNSSKPGILKFLTWSKTSNTYGGTTGVFVAGGHDSPSFTLSFQPLNVTQYQVFSNTYNPTYGKRMYVYPDYNNPNCPDQTPVTIGYLKQNGLMGTAMTTSSAGPPDDEGNPTTVLTQSSLSVPAQLELDGRTDTGRGFTLQGKTQAQPTNSSAILLTVQHSSSSQPAEIEYYGSTGATGDCIQTATSVNAKITQRINEDTELVKTGQWAFINQASNSPGSTMDGFYLVDYMVDSQQTVHLIVKPVKNSNIVEGDVVCTLPEGYRPTDGAMAVFRLVSSNGDTFADGYIGGNGQIKIGPVTGAGNTRMYGMCTYTIYNPDA